MKYKCKNCGHVFYKHEALKTQEGKTEIAGFECYEVHYYSPCCGAKFERIKIKEFREG